MVNVANNGNDWVRDYFRRHGLPWREPDPTEVERLVAEARALLPSIAYEELLHEADDARLFIEDAHRMATAGDVAGLRRLLALEEPQTIAFVTEGAAEIGVRVCMEALQPIAEQIEARLAPEFEGSKGREIQARAYVDLRFALSELTTRAIANRLRKLTADGVASVVAQEPGAPDRDDLAEKVRLYHSLSAEERALLRAHAETPRDDESPRSAAEHMQVYRLRRRLQEEAKRRLC